MTRTETEGVLIVSNAHAIPIGVGRDIEADIVAGTLGGTLKQAKSFREIDDEPPAKSLIAIDSGTTKLSKSEY
jgi:hypothetical protein